MRVSRHHPHLGYAARPFGSNTLRPGPLDQSIIFGHQNGRTASVDRNTKIGCLELQKDVSASKFARRGDHESGPKLRAPARSETCKFRLFAAEFALPPALALWCGLQVGSSATAALLARFHDDTLDARLARADLMAPPNRLRRSSIGLDHRFRPLCRFSRRHSGLRLIGAVGSRRHIPNSTLTLPFGTR